MNKAELIATISEAAGITKVQANAALDSFTAAVQKTLKKDDKVTLVGFGTFSVSKRQARKGRNPQTGDAIKIAAKNVAKFKPGKDLSTFLNAKKATPAKKAVPAKKAAPAKKATSAKKGK